MSETRTSLAAGPAAGGSLVLLRALIVAGIVVPALLFLGAAWHERGAVVAEAERSVVTTTLILHEHALKVFEAIESAVARIDDRLHERTDAEIAASRDLHLFLARIADETEHISSIGVTDARGIFIVNSRSFPAQPLDASEREYFRIHRDRDVGYLIGEAVYGLSTGRTQFNITRRRSAPDGRFAGLIAAAVYADYFGDFYRAVAEGKDASLGITRADGSVLTRFPPVGRVTVLSPQSGFMRAIARDPVDGLFRAVGEVDGVERLFAYRRIGAHPVYATYGLATAEIFGAWHRNLVPYALFAALAAIGLSSLAWTALRRAESEARSLARWAAEQARRERVEEILRHTQKMEAVGQLTGGIAHDFNNLLTVIGGGLDALPRFFDTPERRDQLLKTMGHAAERAERLTNQLLAFSRRQILAPEIVDLESRIGPTVAMLRSLLTERVGVEVALARGLWPIEVDWNEFEVAVVNIAANARDAMPAGGRFRIDAENVELAAGDPAAAGVAPGAYVRIALSDTGVGIPGDVIDRVFDPFFTTKDVGKGTGLGLSQVYGFVTQSRGRVDIVSAPGRGTTVRLFLPRAQVRAPTQAPSEPALG